MTFGRVLRGVTLHEGPWVRLRSARAGHLDDDLNAAFVGHSVRKQLADRRRNGILARVTQRYDLGGTSGAAVIVCGSIAIAIPIPIPVQDAPASTPRLGDRLFVTVTILEAVSNMCDRQLIARLEPADFHSLAIDPDAVGAT
jgi:hypothetical protein